MGANNRLSAVYFTSLIAARHGMPIADGRISSTVQLKPWPSAPPAMMSDTAGSKEAPGNIFSKAVSNECLFLSLNLCLTPQLITANRDAIKYRGMQVGC